MTEQIDLPLSTLPPTAQGAIEAFLIGGGFRYSVFRRSLGWTTLARGRYERFGELDLTFYLLEDKKALHLRIGHDVRWNTETEKETRAFIDRLHALNGGYKLEVLQPEGTIQLGFGFGVSDGDEFTVERLEKSLRCLAVADSILTPRLCMVTEGFKTAAQALQGITVTPLA